jgi:hypothetical protein
MLKSVGRSTVVLAIFTPRRGEAPFCLDLLIFARL